MRKILLFIGIFLLLLACAKNNKEKNSVDILVRSWNRTYNDRNGEDYIKLWMNDTLLFSGTSHINYVDSIRETWCSMEMKVATIHKVNRDSIKIRIRLITLDSVLFAGHHALDTTFCYRIDNISCMIIDYYRELNSFQVWDPITTPQAFQFE